MLSKFKLYVLYGNIQNFIEETLRNFDGNEHLMEEVLVYYIKYETLYMNYLTKTAVILIK